MLQPITNTQWNDKIPYLTEAEAQASARAIVTLFGKWGLSDAQAVTLLGGMSLRSFARWKSGDIGRIDRDLATRLSLFLGIHKALRIIFTDPARAYGWITRGNDHFAGKSPLEVMMAGDMFSVMRVRSHLDAERGPW